MNTEVAGLTRTVHEPIEKVLTRIRRLLLERGLDAIEFDLSKQRPFRHAIARRSCVVLLVDSPVLLFEAIALDRAAAVFLPLHVVVSGDQDTSLVHWINPVSGSGCGRLRRQRLPWRSCTRG
jgi:hypothetical protein